jgi:hypothetical protein
MERGQNRLVGYEFETSPDGDAGRSKGRSGRGLGVQGFSRRTPLNFLALFLNAINSPDVLSAAGRPSTF